VAYFRQPLITVAGRSHLRIRLAAGRENKIIGRNLLAVSQNKFNDFIIFGNNLLHLALGADRYLIFFQFFDQYFEHIPRPIARGKNPAIILHLGPESAIMEKFQSFPDAELVQRRQQKSPLFSQASGKLFGIQDIIGQVAAPAAGEEELGPQLRVFFKQNHASALGARSPGSQEAGRSSADYRDVVGHVFSITKIA
jgi:hypothetical protein